MKKKDLFILFFFVPCLTFSQSVERSSKNTPRLAEELKARPQLDLNRDGVLTLQEALQARDQRKKRTRTNKIAPTCADVAYGDHPSMQLDFWRAESKNPTALFVWIHGGGFRGGDKTPCNPMLLEAFLEAGVSVASINYRLTGIGPYPMQMHDSAQAIQFLRLNATEWNIDPTRLAAGGGSAGSGISQWLAFHNDLADVESSEPVKRLSSRIRCALALNMQSTYDPRVIQKIIPGDAFDDSALKPFYGLPDDWDWASEKIDPTLNALIKDASPINHLTTDDPPVFIFHSERTRTPGNIHHPNFGTHLETAMNELDIECVRRTDADYNTPNAQYDEMIQFVLRHISDLQ